MIINKEQIDYNTPGGVPGKMLVVSYINKDGDVDFIQYPIPKEQMFEWKYCSAAHADKPFYEWDFEKNVAKTDENGQKIMHQWRSYDNKPVCRVPVKDELPDNRVNELLCSFGSKMEPVFEMNEPPFWSCDIETEVTEDGFPEATEARTHINTISLTRFPKTIMWSRKNLSQDEIDWIQNEIDHYSELHCEKSNKKDITKGYKFEFRYFPTEREMLEDFIDFITPLSCIGGWNFLGYDWLYIYNRCVILNIDIDRISKTRSKTNFKLTPRAGGATINLPLPMHKIIFDYMLVFKTWDMTVSHCENHSLDYIAERVLGMKKVRHEWGFIEFYEKHFKEYCFYNAIDTILVEQIDKELHTARIWYMLTALLRIELNQAFSTLKPTETVMCNFVFPHYKVFPSNKKKVPDTQESYEGAFVWPSRPGVYRYITGFDFASLYPSIMRQFYVSPETFVCKDIKYSPGKDEIKMASGAVYKKDPDAMIPAILTHYFGLRKAAKNDMKQADTELQYYHDILELRKAGYTKATAPNTKR